MEEIIKILLLQYGLPTVVTGGIIWAWFKLRLAKSIEHEYAEKMKSIEHKHNAQIETYKAELTKQTFRYTKVFDSTEKVIVSIFQQLIQLKAASDNYTLSKHQLELEAFDNRAFELWKYFEDNKLYIPKTTAEKITKALITLNAANLHFSIAINEARQPNRAEETYGTIFTNYQKIESQIPKLLEALTDDFQHILGFPISDSKEDIKEK